MLCLLGSVRTPNSIGSKIKTIMDSYNEASRRMNTTGMGLEDWEVPSFKDMLRDTVCRWYYDLEEVLKDRPNVTPWFVNGMKDSDDEENYDDDESCGFETEESFRYESNIEKIQKDSDVIDIRSDEGSTNINNSQVSTSSTSNKVSDTAGENARLSDTQSSSNNDSMNMSSVSNGSNIPSTVSVSAKAKDCRSKVATSSSATIHQISPIKAKSIQRRLYQEKKKQINSRNKKSKTIEWNDKQSTEHDFFVECRESKIKFEKEKYMYVQKVDKERLSIEQERLRIEAEAAVIKKKQVSLDEERFKRENDESALKKEHIKAQTDLEKSRIRLNNIEVYKARMLFKKENPDISDEFLDQYFKLI
jgi:hypothetical protein